MEHKNKPLTLEELRQMDGQPVWCEYIADTTIPSQWMVVEAEMERCGNSEYEFLFDDVDEEYGRTWVAYAHKPIDFDKWEPCAKCRSCFSCAHVVENAKDSRNACFWCEHMDKFKPLAFCPYCGRPLTDAAREMLERKVRGE